ncbi:MAG: carboxypeptidase-like regulatory domain-containing protein [Acidobacteriaceae bacterium]
MPLQPATTANSTRPADGQSPQSPDAQPGGSIYGTVMDSNGNVVVGALVTLAIQTDKTQRALRTNNAGFFDFPGLAPGTFQVTVTAPGFTAWIGPQTSLSAGQYYGVPEIALQIASANTNVRVVPSRYDLAEEQLHAEEKQRILGVFPNFYTTYDWHAEPLSTGQKFQLAWKSSIDPINFAITGVIAGVEQWQNYFSGYGPGVEGYSKRFGASYADGFIGNMIGGAILPSILHQDPRYFYKGTGSVPARALYAIATVVICKGDNGRWQPNYSNVLGTLAAAGISNLYYPSTNQTNAQVTIDNALIGMAADAATALLQEFLLKKISRGVPPASNVQPSIGVQPSPAPPVQP